MARPGQDNYRALRAYLPEARSVELRAYPDIANTQIMPGLAHKQFVTRAHAEEVIMMAASGAMEDPKAVAMAGYRGLCEGKRMSFGGWNAA